MSRQIRFMGLLPTLLLARIESGHAQYEGLGVEPGTVVSVVHEVDGKKQVVFAEFLPVDPELPRLAVHPLPQLPDDLTGTGTSRAKQLMEQNINILLKNLKTERRCVEKFAAKEGFNFHPEGETAFHRVAAFMGLLPAELSLTVDGASAEYCGMSAGVRGLAITVKDAGENTVVSLFQPDDELLPRLYLTTHPLVIPGNGWELIDEAMQRLLATLKTEHAIAAEVKRRRESAAKISETREFAAKISETNEPPATQAP